MRYVTEALVPFFQKCKHWRGQKTMRTQQDRDPPGFLVAPHTQAKELWDTEVRTQRGVHW